jgi:catechol 2,3-dioxygenase-like lactoylglutathione lyase family enzyme
MDQAHVATPVYDRTTDDVGNIVEFGHVNVRVPDQHLATQYYVSALGLTRDPYLMTGVTNMWINVGTAQFHLPTGRPQVARGVVGLVLPDLAALRRRLQRAAHGLAGTRFAVEDAGEHVTVTCPWGNRMRCHAPAPRFGAISLGIPYVEFDAPRGSAAAIVRFYREILDAEAILDEDAGGAFARIGAGPGTKLLYRETDAALAPFDGFHIQISLADFSGPHRRLLARGLISEESDAHQYRFQSLVDLDSGAVLLEVEHEVRSMRHPLFARHLVNRNAEITNIHYAPGQDAWVWSLPPQ